MQLNKTMAVYAGAGSVAQLSPSFSQPGSMSDMPL